jgi:hypothetical protein
MAKENHDAAGPDHDGVAGPVLPADNSSGRTVLDGSTKRTFLEPAVAAPCVMPDVVTFPVVEDNQTPLLLWRMYYDDAVLYLRALINRRRKAIRDLLEMGASPPVIGKTPATDGMDVGDLSLGDTTQYLDDATLFLAVVNKMATLRGAEAVAERMKYEIVLLSGIVALNRKFEKDPANTPANAGEYMADVVNYLDQQRQNDRDMRAAGYGVGG